MLQAVCQPLMVLMAEGVSLVIRKFRIVRRIQEDEILLPGLNLCKEGLEILIVEFRALHQPGHIILKHIFNLTGEILPVVARAPVGNVELAFSVITEHGPVAVFAYEIEIGRCVLRRAKDLFCGDLIVHAAEIGVISGQKSRDQVFLQIPVAEFFLSVIDHCPPEFLIDRRKQAQQEIALICDKL